MDISIHSSFLPQDDPEAALGFYRDILGFEVRGDVGTRACAGSPSAHWPARHVDRAPPAGRGPRDHRRGTPDIVEMMAKGTYGGILLATADLDDTFERVASSGAEIVQEPTEQPYGVRDCAVRDPAGNLMRIQERR